ncbi:alginate O-acetyltransferase AlgX-related protein [Fulvivirga lutea]|uniref:AlgX/AlgJ SGNH hydrolase-like domain-containing protein n=1 Tax=Fulvivirga lutea TaxID=2810512 RepID=A0A975A1R0_9BACT|nr:hypothetical protein [Fulvivirga lutea]QSE98096.1 hypothetical protein JR347_03165 [Fulvivirga lutea]
MLKFRQYIFPFIFLLIVFLPLLDTIFNVLPENKNIENRTLATISLDSTDFSEIPVELQEYFKDNFHGRSLFFDMNMKIKRSLSSKPFKDNSLVIGKNGWYFSNFQHVIDDYRAVRPFTESEVYEIRRSLEKCKEDLADLGIKYYLLIVPNKHTIYSDQLPDYINKIGTKSRLEQLLPSLREANIPIVDIRDVMLESKDSTLYFKTDSHWNLNGSFIGYQELFNKIHSDFPEIKPFQKSDFHLREYEKIGGDIVSMMGMENEIKDTFIEYSPKNGYLYKEANTGDYEMPNPKIFHPELTVSAFEGGNTNLKAVVFKDSYAGYMQQFLNQHFQRTVYIWGHNYQLNKEIVEKESPDMVIQIIVERYLYTLLEASEVNTEAN